jgi:hypothetical protein
METLLIVLFVDISNTIGNAWSAFDQGRDARTL